MNTDWGVGPALIGQVDKKTPCNVCVIEDGYSLLQVI